MGNRTKPRALGVYIFAGGFTVGVSKHFDVPAHFEDGPFGTPTARCNFRKLLIHTDPETWPVNDYVRGKGKIDFLFANPPCAPWSPLNASIKRAREEKTTGVKYDYTRDPRVSCIWRTFSVMEKTRPMVAAIESVRPMLKRGESVVKLLVERAAEIGYATTVLLVDAKNHGIPHRRPRLFVLHHRVELSFDPTGCDPDVVIDDVMRGVKPVNIPKMFRQVENLIDIVPPGGSFVTAFNKKYKKRVQAKERGEVEKVKDRPSFMHTRLEWGTKAGVLGSDCKKVHPDEDRFISVEEAKAIMGFPPGFEVVTPNAHNSFAHLNKGVMPPVAEYLARHVKKSIRAGKRIRKAALKTPMIVDVRHDEVIAYPLVFSEGVGDGV